MSSKINSADITEFISELALLLATNTNHHEALSVLQPGQEKPAMQKLIATLQSEVTQTGQLSAGLARYPQYFEPVIVERIRDSEQQGDLPTVLAKIADYREANDKTTSELMARLVWVSIYPVLLLLATLVIATGLLIFVVPVFAAMFKDFGADLPALTAAIVILSDVAVDYWPIILGGLFIFAIVLEMMRRQGKFLYLPFLGRLLHKAMLIRFLRSYALLYSPTLSPQKTLEGCVQLVNNLPYTHCLRQMTEQLNAGQTFPEVLIQQSHFPKKLGHLAAVGLKTQKIDELFNKLALRYAQQLHRAVELTAKIFFVIAMIIVGTIVGALVLAMYLPIFRMGSII